MNIKEVAKLSGVSVSTVSRVLNNHPYVSKKSREKVLEIIEKYHFVPHTSAVDLVRPQTDSIGVIVRGMGNIFFNEMIYILEKEIVEAGYSIYIEHIHSIENELEAAGKLAKSKKLKGIILLGGRNDYQKEEVKVLDVPFVCCTFTNNFGELADEQYSSVCIDDTAAAFYATEYLIQKGHKDIAILLARPNDRAVSELRYKGYVQAHEKYGLTPREDLMICCDRFSMEGAYQSMQEFVKQGKEYSAIFAISDAMALAAMKVLSENGKVVPKDCSVISIDGLDIAKYYIPTLTTFVQPRDQMAIDAVRILDGYIKGNNAHTHLIKDVVLREGGSVLENKL